MDSTRAASTGFRTPDKWNSVPVPERVARRAYENVDKRPDGCWISRYSVASHGYSQIGWKAAGSRHMVLGHRAAWVHVNGQLPLAMTIDHLCKERRCVNPDHLRLLPNFENARRTDGKDWPMGQCANGHPNSLRVPYVGRIKRGRGRESSICAECRRMYFGRHNWKTRHPGEPMPARLLLDHERQEPK